MTNQVDTRPTCAKCGKPMVASDVLGRYECPDYADASHDPTPELLADVRGPAAATAAVLEGQPVPVEGDDVTDQDKDAGNVLLRAGFLRGLAMREGLDEYDRLMLRRASRSLRAYAFGLEGAS
jgi:hypothetical protein